MPIAIHTQPGRARPTVDGVIAALAARPGPVVLDSADSQPGRGRFTIAAFEPVRVRLWHTGGEDPFTGLGDELRATSGPLAWQTTPVPPAARVFSGGWVGYFAYEAGRFIETLPATTADDVALPLARFALYDSAAVHDARTGDWTLVAADLPRAVARGVARPSPAERLAAWQALLADAERKTPVIPPPPPPELPRHNMTRSCYERMVQRAIAHIAAGDIFQVNLARRESFPVREPPATTYLRLRQTNPAAYAAFLQWDEVPATAPDGVAARGASRRCAILSSSPELFLHVRDGRVLTRPIKGTRPRSSDSAVDAAQRAELAASAKDRAELAMIVDLERNDLGRVCRYGSVRVVVPPDSPAAPFALESHPTVHHLVADVAGELSCGFDVIDLLRACFPGGSITGAPKVRAMEIIDALEPTVRSLYTGSIGYVGLDGAATFNIAIRTLIAAGERIHLYAGGGIVADSRPADEYEETVAKALGMRWALDGAGVVIPDPCATNREVP